MDSDAPFVCRPAPQASNDIWSTRTSCSVHDPLTALLRKFMYAPCGYDHTGQLAHGEGTWRKDRPSTRGDCSLCLEAALQFHRCVFVVLSRRCNHLAIDHRPLPGTSCSRIRRRRRCSRDARAVDEGRDEGPRIRPMSEVGLLRKNRSIPRAQRTLCLMVLGMSFLKQSSCEDC